MKINKLVPKILVVCSLPAIAIAVQNNDDKNKSKGIDTANFDMSVDPKQDFFNFVNGNWIKNNPIPASESGWGSFNELNEKNTAKLKTLLEEAAADKSADQGSNRQKIGTFYSMGMDSALLEKQGITPLKSEIAKINGMKSKDDVVKVLAQQSKIGIPSFFSFAVYQDFKNSSVNASYLFQGGTGLPEKDYYLGQDASLQEIRTQYVSHIEKMFLLMGDKPDMAKKNAQVVMDMETALAKASMSAVEQRNLEAMYNKKTIAELTAENPNINWNVYFKEIGVTGLSDIIVGMPLFVKEVDNMLVNTPIENIKAYMRWHLINTTSGKLNTALVNEHFNFFGTVLSGIKENKPRWKRCLELTDQALGEGLGQIYVEKYFSAESKRRVEEMVNNLIAAYKERIATRDWMSAETKKQANEKLNTVMKKLGYPDKWKDYSGLEIKKDSYVQNFMRANEFEFRRMLAKLGQPIDKTEWGMSPPTINAYYNPTMNEIVFPAGIMQPPFFNPDADDAVNYGAMGAVIGHELTHGFDDQGAQFDAQGNLKNWWTEQDLKNFQERTAVLKKQFDSYVVIDSMRINGDLTLGENIADLGGLTIAYYAYKKSLEGKPVPSKIDGYTGEQRFFISWAQGWRGHQRPQALKQMIKTNPHSPQKYRVIGPLSNMPEFYEAFGVKEGHAMYRAPQDRANIW